MDLTLTARNVVAYWDQLSAVREDDPRSTDSFARDMDAHINELRTALESIEHLTGTGRMAEIKERWIDNPARGAEEIGWLIRELESSFTQRRGLLEAIQRLRDSLARAKARIEILELARPS